MFLRELVAFVEKAVQNECVWSYDENIFTVLFCQNILNMCLGSSMNKIFRCSSYKLL